MTDEETITIRISKSLIDQIRTLKSEWQAVNATMITDIVLREKVKHLQEVKV